VTTTHAAATRLAAILTKQQQLDACSQRRTHGWRGVARALRMPVPTLRQRHWERDRRRAEHAALLCQRVLLRERLARYANPADRHAAAQRRSLERGLAQLEQRLADTAQQIVALDAPTTRTRVLSH
jgi:hypothetical protein